MRHPFTLAPGRVNQRGAAILLAMLTVVLVATLASAALWQQWRAVEVEAAERARAQSTWVLGGALDWARLILSEDGRKGGSDHLGEPWAIPLEQARLSTFLAADRSDSLAADASSQAFLSGHITDLQSQLNLRNLVQDDGKVHPATLKIWERLFSQLGLQRSGLDTLVAQLTRAQSATADAPLWPQDPEQLAWLGLDAATAKQLKPYVTVLPERTPVNLNTASATVLSACLDGLTPSDAQRLLQARRLAPWASLDEVKNAARLPLLSLDAQGMGVSTRFFALQGALHLDGRTVQEYSVVQRDGTRVKVLWRKRPLPAEQALGQGIPNPTMPTDF